MIWLALLISSAVASAFTSSAHLVGRTFRKSGMVGAGGKYKIGCGPGWGTVGTGAGMYTGCGGAIVVAALAGAVE